MMIATTSNQTILHRRFRFSNLLVAVVVYYSRFSLLCCFLQHLLFLFGGIGNASIDGIDLHDIPVTQIHFPNSKESSIQHSSSGVVFANQSWNQTVLSYGILLSAMQLGISLASNFGSTQIGSKASIAYNVSRLVQSFTMTKLCFQQILLCISYLGICFVSRFSVLLLLFFLLGFISSRCLTMSFTNPVTSFHSQHQVNNSDRNRELLITIFLFVALISGFLYAPHSPTLSTTSVESSPMRYNASCLFGLVCVSVAYHFCLARMLLPSHSRQKSTSLDSGISSNSVISRSQGAIEEGKDDGDDQPLGAVPLNFLSVCGNNEAKAAEMYRKMLRWRRDNGVENILTVSQSSQHVFQSILEHYPHFLHGVSRDGCGVVYELLGRARPHKLREAGVTMDQLVWHFVIRNELVFHRLRMRNDANVAESRGTKIGAGDQAAGGRAAAGSAYVPRMMTVLDVSGIGIGSVTKDVLSFIIRSSEIMDNYYPEQVSRLVIVNSPSWFSSIWVGIARVLPAAVKQKVDILPDVSQLDKYIHSSQRPVAYGGSGVDLGQAEEHLAFLRLPEIWTRPNSISKVDNGESNLSASGDGSSQRTYRAVDISQAKGHRTDGGLWRWLRMGGSQPNPAFLGEKNRYHFNASTQSWDLDLSAEEPDEEAMAESRSKPRGSSPSASPKSPATSPSSSYDLEEHQLVLAIQAAHLAAGLGRSSAVMGTSGGGSGGGGMGATGPASDSNSGKAGGSSGVGSIVFSDPSLSADRSPFTAMNIAADPSNSSSSGASKPSAHVFLLVCGLYILCSTVQSALLTLLPVWLSSGRAVGGAGLSVQDLCLCLSGAALLALNAQVFFSHRFEHILRASPLRTLRIGAGLLIIAMLGLHPCAAFFSATSPETSPKLTSLSSPWSLSVNLDLSSSHSQALNSSLGRGLSAEEQRLLALPSLAVLLCLAVCASHICRRSSGVLFHVVLSSSFSSPWALRVVVSSFCSISGCLGSAAVHCAVSSLGLPYPMDCGFFLFLGSAVVLSVYIASIFLCVQFRGDYGLMGDCDSDGSSSSSTGNSSGSGSGSGSGRGALSVRPSSYDSGKKASSTSSARAKNRNAFPTSSSGVGLGSGPGSASGSGSEQLQGFSCFEWVRETVSAVVAIPCGDIGLLSSQISAGYGSKLYNMKDDFKDL